MNCAISKGKVVMNKLVSILIITLLVMPSLLACKSTPPPKPGPAQAVQPAASPNSKTGQSVQPAASPIPKAGQASVPPQPAPAAQKRGPFTFDYKLSESNIGFFTQGDDITTLLAAGPFYSGSQPLPSQGTADYDAARTRKVAEIIKEADTLAQTVIRLKPQMAVMRSAFLAYLTTIRKEEPKLGSFVKETFGQVATLAVKEQLVEAQYNSIAGSGNDRSLAGSFMDYTKVQNAVEMGGLYLEDANNMLGYAAIALKAAENHPKAEIRTANAQLDKDMQALDGIRKDLTALASSMEKIDYGLKQLYTASYYFSRSANDFMATSLPDLKAKAASLTPKEGLTAENIQAVRAYLALMEKWQSQMRERTDSPDKSKLISIEPQKERRWFVFAGVADAAVEPPDDYTNAVSSLRSTMKAGDQKKDDSGYLAKGWNAARTAYHGAQTAIGVTIDTAGAVVANTSRIPLGIYYGNSARDIVQDQKNNWNQVADNFKKGTSGSETLRTAGDYLEAVELAARETVENPIAGKTGLGDAYVIPWAAGAITQATVGMFTGLGKGLYKLADRQSDATRLVEGGLDVGLSLVGGSKVITQGSKVPGVVKGLAGEAEMAGKMGLNYVESAFAENARKNLLKESAELLAKNNLSGKEAAKLISNSLQIQAREELARGLAAVRGRMTLEMTQIIKTGGANALAGAKETIKGSLEDMLKQQFELSAKGVIDAFGKVVGTSGKEYLDNLIAGWADDMIKAQVTAMVEAAAADAAASGAFKLAISPQTVDLPSGGKQEFKVTLTGIALSPRVQWSVPDGGTLSAAEGPSVVYTAPDSKKAYKIVATATVGGRTEQATAIVNVISGVWVLTGTKSSTVQNYAPSGSGAAPRLQVNATGGAGEATISYEGPNPNRSGTNLVYKWRFTWSEPPARYVAGDMIKGTGKVEATVGLTGTPKNPDDNYRFMSLKGSGGIVFGGSLGQVGSAGLYVDAINPGETRTVSGTPGGYEFRGNTATFTVTSSANGPGISGFGNVSAVVTYTYELKAP